MGMGARGRHPAHAPRASRDPLAATPFVTPTHDTVILRSGVSCGASPVAHLDSRACSTSLPVRINHHLHTRSPGHMAHGQQKREC